MIFVELVVVLALLAGVWWLKWGRARPADVVPPHLGVCASCRCERVGADRWS